mmetsp:Transcript_80946/g.153065  ORF Transcript_80946/g.153065 Transcript_80946/m.153065 type:complete len:296 (-) Transcript_80946:472-1359(-)
MGSSLSGSSAIASTLLLLLFGALWPCHRSWCRTCASLWTCCHASSAVSAGVQNANKLWPGSVESCTRLSASMAASMMRLALRRSMAYLHSLPPSECNARRKSSDVITPRCSTSALARSRRRSKVLSTLFVRFCLPLPMYDIERFALGNASFCGESLPAPLTAIPELRAGAHAVSAWIFERYRFTCILPSLSKTFTTLIIRTMSLRILSIAFLPTPSKSEISGLVTPVNPLHTMRSKTCMHSGRSRIRTTEGAVIHGAGSELCDDGTTSDCEFCCEASTSSCADALVAACGALLPS